MIRYTSCEYLLDRPSVELRQMTVTAFTGSGLPVGAKP